MDERTTINEHPAQVSVEGCWLLLSYPDNPIIRLDARMVDRVVADDDHLCLALDDANPLQLLVSGGATAARSVAEELRPLTRAAPITRPEVYAYAKRRLDLARGIGNPPLSLLYGTQTLSTDHRTICVGGFKYLISDVELCAAEGGPIPLPNGFLPACVVLFVIMANERVEDVVALSRRIAEYEARVVE